MASDQQPESKFYTSARLRLHYAEWGDPLAPPVLLIHGGRDQCRSWDWVARELGQRYRVIAMDLRGHGDSEWVNSGAYNLTDYIFDIAELVEQLGLAPLRIIAHSLGGAVAARYAGLNPTAVSKLVNVEGFGLSPSAVAKRLATPVEDALQDWRTKLRLYSDREPRRYPSIDAAEARMAAAHPKLSTEQVSHLTQFALRRSAAGGYCWKFDPCVRVEPATTLTPEENARLYGRVRCPVLMIRGLDSWVSDPATDGRGAVYRDIQFADIENAGHWVHHDQLSVFLELVDAFL